MRASATRERGWPSLNERARVARELHDSVAHAISVMVLQAGAADQVLDSAPDRACEAAARGSGRRPGSARPARAAARPARLRATAGRRSLRSPGSPTSSGCSRPCGGPGCPCGSDARRARSRCLPRVDGAAYRVIQEALTNALKHSGAAPTEVTVRYAADGVELEIVDRGTRSRAAPTPGGHGLAGMRERVERHGGQLHAGPAAGGSGSRCRRSSPARRRGNRRRADARVSDPSGS